MSHGKFETKRKRLPLALWIVLILAVLGMSFGGVVAYLSASADPVTNSFTATGHPTITVNNGYTVTVTDPGYAVYLRAKVVVNWKSATGILTAMPNEYSLAAGENWFLNKGDGFYYYKLPVQSGGSTPAAISFTPNPGISQPGYTLTADMIVQAIQAVGTTDADDKSAVEDAWGITPEQIKNGTSTN